MGTTIGFILKLALLAPVFFVVELAGAESLGELRRELAITSVEDKVSLATHSYVTLFADREDRNTTYLRWSRDPRLLFSARGWVLEFTGYVVRNRPGIKEAVRGYAELIISQRSTADEICHFAEATRIYLQSFVGPMSFYSKSGEARIEHCVKANIKVSDSQSKSK